MSEGTRILILIINKLVSWNMTRASLGSAFQKINPSKDALPDCLSTADGD